jgi:thymidylate kinase
MAKYFPERILTIDASKTPEEVSKVMELDIERVLA